MSSSVLPPEVHAALEQLLQGLQSTDNAVRSQAEEQLNREWVTGRPGLLLMGLVEQMQGSQDEGVSTWRQDNMMDGSDSVIDTRIRSSPFPKNIHANLEVQRDRRTDGDLPATASSRAR